MPPKPPKIAQHEWDRHKDAVKALYAQHTLIEVIERMREEYGFSASKSQYEAQLKSWGIKKNLTRKEWETQLSNADGPIPSSLTTSCGRVIDEKRIQRGKRYISQLSTTEAAQPPKRLKAIVPTTSSESFERGPWSNITGQQLLTSQPPSAPVFDDPLMILVGSLDGQRNEKDPLNAQDVHTSKLTNSLEGGSGWSFDGMTSGILGPSMTPFQRLASPTPELPFNNIEDSQLAIPPLQSNRWDLPLDDLWNLARFNADHCSSGFLQWSPSNTSPLYHQESSIETDVALPSSSAIGSGRLSVVGQQSFGLRNQWLQSLPSAKLEAFLGDQSMILTLKSNSVLKPSLSGSLTLMSFSNILNKSDGTTAGHVNQVKTFRMLSGLIPSTAGAVISEQQITDTSIIKMIFLSIMNGFSGMNHLPIDSLLPCLRRLGIFKPLFQQFLLGPPSPAKRSFIDNLFKASIYANDEEMVHIILKHNLVDVNNTTYLCEGRRWTPMEKAASLQALNIIRILANHGAGVNAIDSDPMPSYRPIYASRHGALEHLLCKFTRSAPEDPSLELLNTIRLLVAKGSKVRATRLNNIAKRFSTGEVVSLLSQAISPADHSAFFERSHPEFGNPVNMVSTATLRDEHTSLCIIKSIMTLCQSHASGSCFAEFADVTEEAAVQAARRGRLAVVKLMIDFAKSTDLILSAAISSRNPDLIQFLLSRRPNLNPPARSYQHVVSGDRDVPGFQGLIPTTPFAEAIRTGDSELIRLLESEGCGAFRSLTDHGRLEAAILAVVERADIPRLRHLLSIASHTKVKLRLSGQALWLALSHGHEEVAEILIEAGTQLDLRELGVALYKRSSRIVATILATDLSFNPRGWYPANAALEWADPSVLQSLIYVMSDIQLAAGRLNRAIVAEFCSHCMDTNNFDLFQFFVESTSDPWNDRSGCLAVAVRKGHRTMASYLLQKGANLSHPSVIAAAIPDRPDMLSFLFGNAMQDWKQASSPQKCVGARVLLSLMTEDTESAEAKVLDQLLEIGAVHLVVPERITTKEPKEYFSTCVTPLGLAILGIPDCCNTSLSAINKFLKAGADPNGLARLETKPYRCVTALMAALETGRRDIVASVIDRGANVNLQPRLSLRRTPLQYAAELGDLDMIRLLLQHGADVNSPPAFQGGGTALQFAAISGNCNSAMELLEHGASLDIPPSKVDGRWPLEGAAEHGRLDMIQLLWNSRELSPGNVGFEKRQCLRAMDFAKENGHFGCQDLLSELSGLSVEMLDTEDYGVPWLA